MATIMAAIHYLKKSHNEAVVKCYKTDANGGTTDISLANLVADGETFDANTAVVTIKEIFWGAKKDKQLDLTRIVPSDPSGVHGHYYFTGAGSHEFGGFTDDTYANNDIRIVADGAFHMILKLTKVSGYTKN
jgi:uncharacterized membrane protein